MQIFETSPEAYFDALPLPQQAPIKRLRKAILDNLPEGFEEMNGSGMVGYVVPYSLYPPGYHCKPKQPLPFMGLAGQKHFIAVYHMGIYSDPALLEWFVTEFPKHSKAKLDMGKSCIRFKNYDEIPYDLIGELSRKITPADWIHTYEKEYEK